MKKLILLCIIVFTISSSVFAEFPYTVTSPFGWRVHPITHKRTFHTGVDVRFRKNTTICALFAGLVIYAGRKGGYGNTVIINHGKNVYTLYGHLNQILVTRGQIVPAGKVIALSGSTGRSTGPHLHLEYWRKGYYVNPLEIWQKRNSY